MAEETSAFFTENFPANRSSGHVGQGGKIQGRAPWPSVVGPLAELQRANTVATGVVDDAMGECCAHILYTQLVDEELAQLVDPGHESREVLAEDSFPALRRGPGY